MARGTADCEANTGLLALCAALALLACSGQSGTTPADAAADGPVGSADGSTAADARAEAGPDLTTNQGGWGAGSGATAAGGSSADTCHGLALDSAGNSFITGDFTGKAYFGSLERTSTRVREIYVAKLRPDGSFAWVTTASASGSIRTRDLELDGAGNIYIGGSFSGQATLGGLSLSSGSSGTCCTVAFAAKLSPAGSFLWASAAQVLLKVDNHAEGVAVDPAGNSYLCGSFEKHAVFGSTSLTASAGRDLFVARLDPAGRFAWAVSAGDRETEVAHDVAAVGTAGAVIAGEYGWLVRFGGTTLNSEGKQDLFVARLDSKGAFTWATSAGGGDSDAAYGVAADAAGNTYASGKFVGVSTFGTQILSPGGGAYYSEVFAARLDSKGKFAWVTPASYGMQANAVAVNAAGRVAITGVYSGKASFGATSLSSNGGCPDAFVATLDSSGAFTAAHGAGGPCTGNTLHDLGRAVALGSNGTVLAAGEFLGRATFGATTRHSLGHTDIFVWRIP